MDELHAAHLDAIETTIQGPTVLFTTEVSRVSSESLANLFESVGFGTSDGYNSDPEFLARAFGPGVFGFFAVAGGTVVGLARVLSDDRLVAWVAEVCVHPDWQKKGIGRELMNQVNQRFSHTALYLEALEGQVEFFADIGITPKKKLVACSRAKTR